jgi:hypothetical protein
MADNGQLQQGLARDPDFIGRIGYAMGKNALLVKAEPIITPGHAKRVAYASIDPRGGIGGDESGRHGATDGGDDFGERRRQSGLHVEHH